MNYKKRLIAIILAFALILPTAVFAADETGEGAFTEEAPEVEISTEAPEEAPETPEATGDLQSEEDAEVPPEAADPEIAAEPDAIPEEQPETANEEPAVLEGISAEENPTGTAEITWNAFEGASYYSVSSPQINDGEAVRTDGCVQSFSGLDHGVTYDFVVAACDENDTVMAQGAVSLETVAYKINFNESAFRVLGNRTVKPKKLSGNLTKMIGEPDSGYAVVQGGCTDGTYAYYLMVSSKTQKGRVLKVRIKDNKVIKKSKILNTWHGNGMTYDSTRKKLVVIAREHRKQELTVIDAKTLTVTKQRNVKYHYDINAGSEALSRRFKQSGLAAIAYVKKYDCYIALERVYHNLLIFDPDTFECIGLVYTNLGNTGTFQAMDADSKYAYLLLSYYKEGRVVQPYNKIVALDWNSENLLPVVNASKSKDLPYVEKYWYCNNDDSGTPDASIRIRTSREAENIYHKTDKSGKEHFYMAEYYGHYAYKKVGKKRKRYYKRDNYVYDLGII